MVLGVLVAPALAPLMPWSAELFRDTSGGGAVRSTNRLDAYFIEQMVPHHEDAVALAKLALAKAEHLEIKLLATGISKIQSEEIDQMRQNYRDWFGKVVPILSAAMGHEIGAMTHGGIMGNETDFAMLEKAKPFDKALIEQMISHHQMAIMMVQMLVRGTSRPEMVRLAENIITTQTNEIDQMRDWYEAWYKD